MDLSDRMSVDTVISVSSEGNATNSSLCESSSMLDLSFLPSCDSAVDGLNLSLSSKSTILLPEWSLHQSVREMNERLRDFETFLN